MRSLVLDQATRVMGFAIVEEDPTVPVSFGVCGKLLQHGVIETPLKAGLLDRLNIMRADLTSLIKAYQPEEIVVEDTTCFRQPSASTNAAMGAIYMLCREVAAEHHIGFYSQNPRTIKAQITGNGNADKQAVIEAVMHVWGMPRHQIKDDNHADALAAAYIWFIRGEEVRQKVKTKKGKRRA